MKSYIDNDPLIIHQYIYFYSLLKKYNRIGEIITTFKEGLTSLGFFFKPIAYPLVVILDFEDCSTPLIKRI